MTSIFHILDVWICMISIFGVWRSTIVEANNFWILFSGRRKIFFHSWGFTLEKGNKGEEILERT